MNHSLKYILPALLALLVVAAGCGGANGSDSPSDAPQQRRVRVESLVLSPTRFEDVVEITGSVESVNDAVLSAQASGTVQFLAERGQRVGQGAVVARIDPGMMATSVAQAEAVLEAAQAAYAVRQDAFERNEGLYQDSIVSAIEFENVRAQRNQARANLRQAEAALAQAREQLSHTRVVSPFAGVVEERLIEVGEQVSPGQQMVRVVNTSRVKVIGGVPERYAGDVTRGTSVLINLNAYGGQAMRGTVSFAGAAIDPNSRTFPIEVELPNPEGRLKPEMVARLFVTRQEMTDALVVPRPAILRDESGNSVFVVRQTDSTAVAERRLVTLGATYAGKTVIESGLQAGDEVVVLGQNDLTEGDRLEVVQQYRNVDAAGVPLTDEASDTPSL